MWNLKLESETEWPRFRQVRQDLKGPRVADIRAAVAREVASVEDRIEPGRTYALGVGSRGVRNIAALTAAVVAAVRQRGAKVFIVPAMGSHGGATAAGQREVLESLGVTEATVGAPIDDAMDVEVVARLSDGTPLYFSRAALRADGVIPLNRVKPHTDFHGPHESGLVKMLVIGFGKQVGAASVHSRGFLQFKHVLPEAGRILLDRVSVPFGVAVVENGREETALVEAIRGEEILDGDRRLLDQARSWMATLPFQEVDLLVVGRLGKNISGSGMDPNVTGRWLSRAAEGGLDATRLTVLNVTPESHGNAVGLGAADTIPRHFYESIDWEKTYMNVITSTELSGARIPMVLANDRQAVEAAIRSINGRSPAESRTVVIRDTLSLEYFAVSEGLWEEAQARGLEAHGEWQPIHFEPDGSLLQVAGIPLR